MCVNPADAAENGPDTGSPSHTPGLEGSLIRLVLALVEQSAAINRLAKSNEALVRAMAEDGDDPDDSMVVGLYLNSRPAD